MEPTKEATGAVDEAADKPQNVHPPKENKVAEATPYLDGIGTEMVDIYVGPSKKLFRLYKAKLCSRIPFFEKMFNANCKEASENVAHLLEDDPASFDLLAEWANQLTTSQSSSRIRELTMVKNAEGKEVVSWDPVGFYSLAEKYGLPELQDVIMDAFIQLERFTSVDFVFRAYKHTSAGSGLARYCAKSIFYVMDNGIEDDAWPTEEVARLLRELPTFASDYLAMQRKAICISGAQDPRHSTRCYFHTHARDKPCAGNLSRKRKTLEGEKRDENKRPRGIHMDDLDSIAEDSFFGDDDYFN